MSIVDTQKIDSLGAKENEVGLLISDHLDWDNTDSHLELLRDKLNTYLTFCLDGQLERQFPESSGKEITIRIISKFPYPEAGQQAIEKTKRYLLKNHPLISVEQELLSESEDE